MECLCRLLLLKKTWAFTSWTHSVNAPNWSFHSFMPEIRQMFAVSTISLIKSSTVEVLYSARLAFVLNSMSAASSKGANVMGSVSSYRNLWIFIAMRASWWVEAN